MKLSYYGYFTPFGGYGIVNLGWVRHLRRLGVEVYPHRKFEIHPGTPEWEALDEEEREIFSLPFAVQRLGIVETTPFDLPLIETKIKIANTMCEADFLSPKWVMPLNKMDFIIVPNEWNKMVFRNSGVRKPIEVIPHGQDINMFPIFDRLGERYDAIQKGVIPFRFGIVAYLNERKGFFELLQAFSSEFNHGENVQLYLKSSNKAFGYYNNFKDKRIVMDARHLPMPQIAELYNSFDCFVFPTKAEGVGNPPREALLTGCPVIATNYSGIEEMVDYIYPLTPAGYEKRTDMLEQPGNWAKIDIQELMFQMRNVYENYKEALEFSFAGATWMREEFRWPKVTRQLINFLKEIDS